MAQPPAGRSSILPLRSINLIINLIIIIIINVFVININIDINVNMGCAPFTYDPFTYRPFYLPVTDQSLKLR